MGNTKSKGGHHWVYVKTGDRKDAGTDANISITLRDANGKTSPEIKLDFIWKNDFERGQTDSFQTQVFDDLGPIVEIVLCRDNNGIAADWYCELITVKDVKTDEIYYFPVHRWVQPHRKYFIPQFDTSLPLLDLHPQQRQYELERKRKLYSYSQHDGQPGLPVRISELPEDEQFSDYYQGDFNRIIAGAKLKGTFLQLSTGKLQKLQDLSALYKSDSTFPEPKGLSLYGSDEWFGAQRLVGCSPFMIKLCTHIPDNMAVTGDMLQPFLEGRSLQQVIADNRLFITDYKILKNLPTKDNHTLCAPIALWFLNGDNNLMPLAIQLYQDIQPDNPVFFSDDPPFTWELVKMWLNLADSTVHQSLSHLGFTHLLMEGVCIATHRNLAHNHPVFRLLAPHCLFLLAINSLAVVSLISVGGFVDKASTVGTKGMFALIQRGIAEWRLDVQGSLPRELESRGLLDEGILPNSYPYRNDGLLVYKAIENYVTTIVQHYYDAPPALHEDAELQAWVQDLATPAHLGGVGLNGVPNNGRFKTTGEVIEVLTNIIFTSSAQHGVVNFAQYDEYGFPPNYPTFLSGEPPRDRSARCEEDVVSALPNMRMTLDVMTITKMLSWSGTNCLGQWEFQYQYDPPAIQAEKQFREELDRASKTIKQRNKQRGPWQRYEYMDPEVIPNSPSI